MVMSDIEWMAVDIEEQLECRKQKTGKMGTIHLGFFGVRNCKYFTFLEAERRDEQGPSVCGPTGPVGFRASEVV